jgi:hypothetical protein
MHEIGQSSSIYRGKFKGSKISHLRKLHPKHNASDIKGIEEYMKKLICHMLDYLNVSVN